MDGVTKYKLVVGTYSLPTMDVADFERRVNECLETGFLLDGVTNMVMSPQLPNRYPTVIIWQQMIAVADEPDLHAGLVVDDKVLTVLLEKKVKSASDD